MERFELHIIYTLSDAELALRAGLLDNPEGMVCEHCGEVVGEDLDEFYPFAIVLDE